MLNKVVEQQILSFVQEEPRTIQDIAQLTGRNWRTADSYVRKIATETGLVAIKKFRGGTQGALKIVYWSALDQTQTSYQERLSEQILAGRWKEDFSPFDIYQFVEKNKRSATNTKVEMNKHLLANEQILSFSGNLSWINKKSLSYLESLAKKRVSIKIMCRVDMTSRIKTEQLLAINHRVGWDAIAIRHCAQPLRAIISDDTVVRIKEVFSKKLYPELDEKTFIFYEITEKSWIHWLQKVFWKLWETSIDSGDRLNVLKAISS